VRKIFIIFDDEDLKYFHPPLLNKTNLEKDIIATTRRGSCPYHKSSLEILCEYRISPRRNLIKMLVGPKFCGAEIIISVEKFHFQGGSLSSLSLLFFLFLSLSLFCFYSFLSLSFFLFIYSTFFFIPLISFLLFSCLVGVGLRFGYTFRLKG
jgi:hypothetical protein